MSDKPNPCGQFTSQDHRQLVSGELKQYSPSRAEKLEAHRGTCRYCDEGITSVGQSHRSPYGSGNAKSEGSWLDKLLYGMFPGRNKV